VPEAVTGGGDAPRLPANVWRLPPAELVVDELVDELAAELAAGAAAWAAAVWAGEFELAAALELELDALPASRLAKLVVIPNAALNASAEAPPASAAAAFSPVAQAAIASAPALHELWSCWQTKPVMTAILSAEPWLKDFSLTGSKAFSVRPSKWAANSIVGASQLPKSVMAAALG